MDEQPGNHIGRRSRARRWRTVLVWVGALAALALATWIATVAALDLAGGLPAGGWKPSTLPAPGVVQRD